MDRYVSNTIS